jgi:hypothetical protein
MRFLWGTNWIFINLLQARIIKPAKGAVARERLRKLMLLRHWLTLRHEKVATYTHATMEKLLETVFSVWSVLRLYKEDQLAKKDTYLLLLTDSDKDRPTLSSERAPSPQGQKRNCQKVTNIWSWAPDGARYQDRPTDWPSVAMWLRLRKRTPVWRRGRIPPLWRCES